MLKKILLLCFLLSNSYANILPESHPVNGGITIIPFESRQKPTGLYNKIPVAVVESIKPNQWLLVLGIPLDTKETIQNIFINKPHSAYLPFYISPKTYKTQNITIKDERKVNPFAEDKERIAQEEKKMDAIYATFNSTNPFQQAFAAPLRGPVTSLFGLNRVYNKEPRPPHSGLDIAAAEGTPVKAVNNGQIIATADYFYTGNTVIIDHGMGVFSLYGHLHEIKVKEGDSIRQGEIVGTVGKTGRATGPHLHWSMIINKTLVDPLLFVNYQFINVPPAPPPKQKQEKIPTTAG
ncbi:peptidase, M23/M37 family (plasmid) [Legionella adelaidensis]|uniref:Peptidase, M23/M37 family n=1 Tax=Legionella adelaidensis TaxID=45056 RepID=A0A0W0R5D3_9GAMM|nr:M23 family metallopeptidase [Legionella adelaidensis]KTC66236.1 peptidase, M23/M37 family [Legionella adelaidensis]VEH85751.1 peptidase, M23/M37 family [Legionella adelaidensis]